MHPDVVDSHDARMVQARQPPRFLPPQFGIRQVSRPSAEHLDSHGPIELGIVAQIYSAEAAGPEPTPHLIAAKRRRDGDAVGGRRARPFLRFRREVRILPAAVLKPHVRIGRVWRISRRRGAACVARLARRGLLFLNQFTVGPYPSCDSSSVHGIPDTRSLSTVLTPTDSAPGGLFHAAANSPAASPHPEGAVSAASLLTVRVAYRGGSDDSLIRPHTREHMRHVYFRLRQPVC